MKRLLILFLFFSIVGCKSASFPHKETLRTVTDSTTIKTRIIPRDTLVVVPADSLKISQQIEALTERAVVRESNKLRLSLRRVGNTIEAECHDDELLLEIALQDKEIEILRQIRTEERNTIRIPERYIPKFAKFLMWVGGIFLGAVVLLVILRIKRVI